MKRIIFILFFIAVGYAVFAQANYNKYNYYSVGIKLGPDFYNYDLDQSKLMSLEPSTNFSFGVTGAYYVSWVFEVHGNINFSSRNLTLLWDFPEAPDALAKSEYKLNYINIPLEARVNALYFNWMKLNFGMGLMPEFRFRPREFLTYQDGSSAESFKFWGTKNFKSFLFAIPLSMNMKFYLDRHLTIEFNASYYLYLNKMHTDYLDKPANALATRIGISYEW